MLVLISVSYAAVTTITADNANIKSRVVGETPQMQVKLSVVVDKVDALAAATTTVAPVVIAYTATINMSGVVTPALTVSTGNVNIPIIYNGQTLYLKANTAK